jgi:hypothetical protein
VAEQETVEVNNGVVELPAYNFAVTLLPVMKVALMDLAPAVTAAASLSNANGNPR